MDRTALIVDSDRESRRRIIEALAEEPIAVVEAETAARALERARASAPDLLVTELDLPDVSGHGLVRLLHDEKDLAHVPVVIVTRYDSEIDRILAFECGVDDFVPKPFFGRELAGRVRAILRRSTSRSGAEAAAPKRRGGVVLDVEARSARVDDEPIALTPREFELLETLMGDAGRVLSRGRLVEAVWGDDAAAGHRSVDTHVKAIRRKLGRKRRVIETVRGVGYRFNER